MCLDDCIGLGLGRAEGHLLPLSSGGQLRHTFEEQASLGSVVTNY